MSDWKPEIFAPPPEHNHRRWHWIETDHGPMCASWYPLIGYGSWDISGHMKNAENPSILREWLYLGPAIPPDASKTYGTKMTTDEFYAAIAAVIQQAQADKSPSPQDMATALQNAAVDVAMPE
jgi:hypothetical protein